MQNTQTPTTGGGSESALPSRPAPANETQKAAVSLAQTRNEIAILSAQFTALHHRWLRIPPSVKDSPLTPFSPLADCELGSRCFETGTAKIQTQLYGASLWLEGAEEMLRGEGEEEGGWEMVRENLCGSRELLGETPGMMEELEGHLVRVERVARCLVPRSLAPVGR